jgi:hypothetical protein
MHGGSGSTQDEIRCQHHITVFHTMTIITKTLLIMTLVITLKCDVTDMSFFTVITKVIYK